MNAEVDLTDVVLKTERLTLRPFKKSDLDDFYEYAKVAGVGEMAGWSSHKSKEESMSILNKFIEGKKTFAVEKDGKVIGSLGIEKYDESEFPIFMPYRARELGFVVSKDYWGQGIATEAVKKVVDFCFNELDMQVLLCGCMTRNLRSIGVQKKAGFTFYKEYDYKTHYGTVEKSIENFLVNPKYKDIVKIK